MNYKETEKMRKERVEMAGNSLRVRIVNDKTKYNRKNKDKDKEAFL